MTRNLVSLVLLGVLGAAGCANKQRHEREPEPIVWEKGLEFLEPVPELRGVSINMTENQFRRLIRGRDVRVRFNDLGEEHTYDVRTRSRENVVVMFTDGKCSGIQRLMRDPPEH